MLEEALHVHFHQLHHLDQWTVLYHGVDGHCGGLVTIYVYTNHASTTEVMVTK